MKVENIIGSQVDDNIVKKADDNYQFESYEFANTKTGYIFDGNIEYSDSNFNRHRADVIRAIITTNLSTAISGFKKYSNKNIDFLMPKISEIDWELLENNICIATFLQGMKVGDKTYNNYAVIPNNFTKEYVDENDIFILKSDKTYARPNDKTLLEENVIENNGLGFYPGVLRINFEKRQDINGGYYNPTTFNYSNSNPLGTLYLQSYTSFSGTSDINSVYKSDMYRYMNGLGESEICKRLRTVYYTALGRERYGSFKYTINDIEGGDDNNNISIQSATINMNYSNGKMEISVKDDNGNLVDGAIVYYSLNGTSTYRGNTSYNGHMDAWFKTTEDGIFTIAENMTTSHGSQHNGRFTIWKNIKIEKIELPEEYGGKKIENVMEDEIPFRTNNYIINVSY